MYINLTKSGCLIFTQTITYYEATYNKSNDTVGKNHPQHFELLFIDF